MAPAAANGDVDVSLITWLPDSDRELLPSLANWPIDVHVIPQATGTVNTNRHAGDVTLATTILDPQSITPADLDDGMRAAVENSDGIMVAPDIEGKLSLELLRELADDVGVPVYAEIGKYYRTLGPDGVLEPRWPWPAQAETVKYFHTVFLSGEDIAVPISQGESVLSMARALADQGPREVIITLGSKGAFIYLAETNEGFDIPAYPPKQFVDPTGAGDTFVGAYITKRMTSDSPAEAGYYAAMAASLKLNYSGPLRETAEEIERALQEKVAS